MEDYIHFHTGSSFNDAIHEFGNIQNISFGGGLECCLKDTTQIYEYP